MLGRTHILIGIFLFLISFLYFDFPLLSILFFILGSLLPDIDTTTSYLGRRVKLVGMVFSHRGFFHSLLFGVLCFAILFYLDLQYYSLGFLIGFVSHLVGDMITKEGLRLYPFSLRIKGPIKVGGFLELIFSVLLVLGCLLLLV